MKKSLSNIVENTVAATITVLASIAFLVLLSQQSDIQPAFVAACYLIIFFVCSATLITAYQNHKRFLQFLESHRG